MRNRQRIRRDRNVETRTVKQWMTNGLEILEEADEIPIPWIPIVPVFGKEQCLAYLNRGRGSVNERKETAEQLRTNAQISENNP